MSTKIMDKEIELELKGLYKKWPDVKRFLYSFGCSTVDAEDIFQEALIIYIRKKESKDFELSVDAFHYIKSTCKLLWFNEARKQNKLPKSELGEELIELESTWFQKEMKLKTIESALTLLGKQCQEILQLFYGLSWNMVKIAEKVGLRNEKVAKAQKYRCLQKAKELTEQKLISSEETHYSL